MNIIIDTAPAEGRPYQFARGDVRFPGASLDLAITEAEKRSRTRGRQAVRSYVERVRTGFMVQDVDETTVLDRPECVRLANGQRRTRYVDRDRDTWFYFDDTDSWACSSEGEREQAAVYKVSSERRGYVAGLEQVRQAHGPLR